MAEGGKGGCRIFSAPGVLLGKAPPPARGHRPLHGARGRRRPPLARPAQRLCLNFQLCCFLPALMSLLSYGFIAVNTVSCIKPALLTTIPVC